MPSRALQLALAQLNPTVGDIDGNAAKIAASYDTAKRQGADLVITPELSITGYPPEDLILSPAFVKAAMAAAAKLAKRTAKGPALIIGCPWTEGKGKTYHAARGPWDEKRQVYNAALLCDRGKILHVVQKIMLPNYSVFDEKRIFSPGSGPKVISWRGHKLGLLVCEDVWSERLSRELGKQKAELLIVINASPFEAGKLKKRQQVTARAAKAAKCPLIYVNAIGGQDDIVFDGGSFVLDKAGKIVAQMAEFVEGVAIIPSPLVGEGRVGGSSPHTQAASMLHQPPLPNPPPQGERELSLEQTLWEAMKLGLADYVRKNNFPGVVLGLSGGIDSAISAALAVDALGAAKVKGVLLPSPYTSKESIQDAEETARLLVIEIMHVPITPAMEIFDEVLSPVFHDAGWMEDISLGGNVQSRLRGMTLMAISNRFGDLLLTTGNKSEIAVGYTTLYGDSCGGYNVLKDVYKTQVYALAEWRNAQSKVIPGHSITRAPSAELAPDQTDQDQLPPYDVLDKILMLHIEGRKSAQEIVAKGFPKTVVEQVVKMVRRSEYKRRQSAPGVKLSPMLFGRDRRFPLTSKF